MPVQAELDSPRRVAAYLDEKRTEVFVVDIEVGVVDVDRPVPVELEPSVHLPSVEGLGFLLCHPNEDNAVAGARSPKLEGHAPRRAYKHHCANRLLLPSQRAPPNYHCFHFHQNWSPVQMLCGELFREHSRGHLHPIFDCPNDSAPRHEPVTPLS